MYAGGNRQNHIADVLSMAHKGQEADTKMRALMKVKGAKLIDIHEGLFKL